MIYAEIQDNQTVIKYPYSATDLHTDNPSTMFDDRFNLIDWYAQTEKALNNNSAIVEIIVTDPPSYDTATQMVQQSSLPELIEGVWTLPWLVTNINSTLPEKLAHEI